MGSRSYPASAAGRAWPPRRAWRSPSRTATATTAGTWAASVEALRQAGVLDSAALRELARYHRPTVLDPHGRVGAETIAEFELAPVGELIG